MTSTAYQQEQTMDKATVITTPSDQEIVSERVFAAPRDRVFSAYTDPHQIPQWWGPRRMTTIVHEMDVRPGGAWRFVSHDPDGQEYDFRGVYREVTPPERLVQTFGWEGMSGETIVETVTFEDLGENTKVTIRSVFHTLQERDEMVAYGMEHGLRESHERLDELLADAR